MVESFPNQKNRLSSREQGLQLDLQRLQYLDSIEVLLNKIAVAALAVCS
jgi:hypothetical protein